MANALGIDLGNVYRTAEAVRNSRQTRAAAEAANGTGENALAMQDARRAAASGDFSQLIALDPSEARTTIAAYNDMDERTRAAEREKVEQLAQVASSILQADQPAQAYAQLIQNLPAEVRSQLPAQYDEQFLQFQLSRAVEIDKLYDSVEGDRESARDFQEALALDDHQTANNVLEDEQTGGSGGGGNLDATTTNAIYRQSVGLFGGALDADGKPVGLDNTASRQAQEIAKEAEKLMIADPNLTISVAVSDAADALNIQVTGSNANPLSSFMGGGNAPAGRPSTGGGNALSGGTPSPAPASDPLNLGL